MQNKANTTASLAMVKSEGPSSTAVESDMSKLSPLPLGEAIAKITAAAVTLQGRSLILTRQAKLSLRPGSTPPEVARRAFDQHDALRTHADVALTRLITGAIERLTDIDRITNLMLPALDQQMNPEVLAAIRLTIRELFDRSAAFSREIGDVDEVLREDERDFVNALDALVTALDGPNGKITAVSKSIEGVQEQLEENLDGILKEAKNIGEAARKLVTNILTTITGHKDDPGSADTGDKKGDKNKGDKNKGEKDKGTGKAKSGDTPAKFDPFPIESISTLSDGAARSSSSMSAYRSNQGRLAELYQQLASLDALLATVRAIADQSRAYVRSVSTLANTAEQVRLAWSDLLAGVTDLEKRLESESMVPATLTEVRRMWVRLGERVQELQLATAGRTTAFPQMSALR